MHRECLYESDGFYLRYFLVFDRIHFAGRSNSCSPQEDVQEFPPNQANP